jgi:rfaE bifunctional protein nucleotidyltransferase chain/domain
MQNHKLISLSELLEIIANLKQQDKKITFTNGVFDILHKGHVAYLSEAKSLGDILILGLNSDASVKRLKGPTRPINNHDDRAFVLAGLESIDYITIFDEDTPYQLLSKIQPDILAKGGDYKIEEVVGREFAAKTALIEFVKGYSTTKVIEKMK